MKRDGFKVSGMAKCESILLQLRFNAIPMFKREREEGYSWAPFPKSWGGDSREEERIRMCYSCCSCIALYRDIRKWNGIMRQLASIR